MILLANIAVEAVKYIRSILCDVPLTLSQNNITRLTEVSFPGGRYSNNRRKWGYYVRLKQTSLKWILENKLSV